MVRSFAASLLASAVTLDQTLLSSRTMLNQIFDWHTARERAVGWYSTGPRLREADLDITELMTNYCDTPLLVICEVQVIFTLSWAHATLF